MAGLIQQQMAGAPADEQQGEMAEQPQPGAMPEQEEGGEVQDSPAFEAAVDFAMQVLYEKEAAKDIAKQIKAAPSVSEGMANIAYDVTSVVDERTDGAVPDELLGVLGMTILSEVAEIAEAAGAEPSDQDVANAFKTMILRFLGEQGVDTTQLQQSMDQVDPNAFKQAAQGSEVPA